MVMRWRSAQLLLCLSQRHSIRMRNITIQCITVTACRNDPRRSRESVLFHMLMYSIHSLTSQADYHDLYWALGDRGPQEDTFDHGQRPDILYGSLVRISVSSDGTDYLVPIDNYPDAGKCPSGTEPVKREKNA